MLESILSLGTEWFVIFGVGALFVTLGFLIGHVLVSEIGLAFAVAYLILQFAPLTLLPSVITWVVSFVPWIPGETTFFVLLVIFGFWVAHSSAAVVDTERNIANICLAAFGTLGIVFLSLSRTVSLGGLYTPGHLADMIFASPLQSLLLVIASLCLLGLSRKM